MPNFSSNQLHTSSKAASVMEFGFKHARCFSCVYHTYLQHTVGLLQALEHTLHQNALQRCYTLWLVFLIQK